MRTQRTAWFGLLFNHIDAWVVTFALCAVALWWHDAFTWQSLYLAVALTAGYWLAFAFNDYCDAPFDALDPAKGARNYFVGRTLTRWARWGAALALGAATLPAFASFGPHGLGAAALGLVVLWAYSAPPLRLKNRPIWDIIVHGVFVETYPYLVCVWLLNVAWTWLDGVVAACALLGSLTAQLEQQVRDYALDVRAEQNFTTRFGRQTSFRLLKVGTALLLGVALTAVLSGRIPPLLWPLGFIPLPAMLHRFVRRPEQARPAWLVYILTGAGILYGGFLVWRAAQAWL